MGFSASAVLAYGYDLGDTLAKFEEDTVRPAWLGLDGYGGGVIGDALRALFSAAGGKCAPDDYLDDTEVFELCGVTLAAYGSINAPTRTILAAKTFGANMDGPELIDLELPDGADWQLMCALRVLGIAPSEPKPRWILAASLG